MTQIHAFGGVDVGKACLDAAVFPGGARWHGGNHPEGRQELIAWLGAHGVRIVGLEATGGYERPLRNELRAAGASVHVLDPARVRHFAKAIGQRAKTDAIDAAMIAEFTAQLHSLPPQPTEPEREAVADLVRTRRLLVDKRADIDKGTPFQRISRRPSAKAYTSTYCPTKPLVTSVCLNMTRLRS